MTDPDMIWIDYPAANRAFCAYDEPPQTDTQHSRTPYRCADLPRPEDAQRIAELEAEIAALRASVAPAEPWQPPEDRAPGYRCMGLVNGTWRAVVWGRFWEDRSGQWYCDVTDIRVTPTAFAPLPEGQP